MFKNVKLSLFFLSSLYEENQPLSEDNGNLTYDIEELFYAIDVCSSPDLPAGRQVEASILFATYDFH
jgi:hypothetical protein